MRAALSVVATADCAGGMRHPIGRWARTGAASRPSQPLPAQRRRRPGSRRADPAAVGARQCRRCRAVDEERRRNGARRIQEPEHPAAREGRWRHAAGAQSAAQQAIAEGAEIIVGPLFAQSVSAVGQVARARNIPVIAFSTDASVAARGVYLLSFLPETDVRRIVDYAVSRGKRSFAALLPDNAYGTVVEAAFQQEVARRGGRVSGAGEISARCEQDGGGRAPRRAGGQPGRQHLHSRRRRRGAAGRASARGQRCEPEARATARHRPVGRSAHLLGQRRSMAAGIAAPESDRLPQLLGPLPRPLRAGSGAHGDARL